MGLDMYLRAERYLSPYSDDTKELMKSIHESLGVANYPIQSGTQVSIGAAYWRKANQIHQWFVENVQEGTDDCKEYEVSREQLTELRDLCATVLEDVSGLTDKDEIASYCEENLPTQSGFFFGDTEYGEYYFNDLKNTIEMLDKALTLSDDWWFKYQSSW